jgi:hypothetical protein
MYVMSSTTREADYRLRKAFALHGDSLEINHRWVTEIERWKELVLALLRYSTAQPDELLREMVDLLDDLDLIDVETLAGSDEDQQRIVALLEEYGVGDPEARAALVAITEAAAGLTANHRAKVQRYLRSYGEMMLAEIPKHFTFTSMADSEIESAFTFWLQNVLDMPLSLFDDAFMHFCETSGIAAQEYREAADRLDVNLAAVDDLLLRVDALAEAEPEAGASSAS